MKMPLLPPIHPGEILKEDFMVPMDLSINMLARDLHVSSNRIGEIVNEKRGITADTALRLARYLNTTPKFWMNLQVAYDLEVSARTRSKQIECEVRPRESSSVGS